MKILKQTCECGRCFLLLPSMLLSLGDGLLLAQFSETGAEVPDMGAGFWQRFMWGGRPQEAVHSDKSAWQDRISIPWRRGSLGWSSKREQLVAESRSFSNLICLSCSSCCNLSDRLATSSKTTMPILQVVG